MFSKQATEITEMKRAALAEEGFSPFLQLSDKAMTK
jgi:hypothetical protein